MSAARRRTPPGGKTCRWFTPEEIHGVGGGACLTLVCSSSDAKRASSDMPNLAQTLNSFMSVSS
jgi:hypothetical protein